VKRALSECGKTGVLPLAVLRDEKRHAALACEPLETSGIGTEKRIKQSLYIAPAARTQYAFKIQRVYFANALISGTSPQSKSAPTLCAFLFFACHRKSAIVHLI
jgi:hypothetical protein